MEMINPSLRKEIPLVYFLYPRNNFSTTLDTCGDSYWSATATSVKVDGCVLNLFYSNNFISSDFVVYVNPLTWYTRTMGYIYTDTLFIKELREFLVQFGIGIHGDWISYSERGLQGINYVSCDVNEKFIEHWLEHKYPTNEH